jgi:hypothetical protein
MSCGLTFELRRPGRRATLGPRRTMEPATALRGPRVARLAGSPLERGVRPHADSPLTLPRHLSSWTSPSARWLQRPTSFGRRAMVPGSCGSSFPWFLATSMTLAASATLRGNPWRRPPAATRSTVGTQFPSVLGSRFSVLGSRFLVFDPRPSVPGPCSAAAGDPTPDSRQLWRYTRRAPAQLSSFTSSSPFGGWSDRQAPGCASVSNSCGLTFELTRPEWQDALAARPMILLHGHAAKAACRGGSRVERGVRRHGARSGVESASTNAAVLLSTA